MIHTNTTKEIYKFLFSENVNTKNCLQKNGDYKRIK